MANKNRKKAHSDEKRFVCDRCGYAASKKCNLIQHIAAQHENISHQCKKCEFNSLYLHKLKKHIQVVHERILLSCNVCDFKTETESALRTHKKTTHSVRKYFCDQCEFKTVYEHTLKTHRRIKHEGIRYDCDLCEYKGGTIYALKDHKKIEHGNFKLQCELCKFTTSRQGNLNVHKKAVHSDNKNKVFCDKCSYSSNYASALKRHIRVKHGGLTSDCEYKAEKKDDLQNLHNALKDHKKIGHKNLKLQCDLCKFTTTRQGNLNVHKKAVHSDNISKVFCDKCSYSSNYSSALKRHIRVKHGGMISDCEYKAEKKDDLHNLVKADSDLCDVNSNVLKPANKVGDILHTKQSGTTGTISSKSGVFSPDSDPVTLGGSLCSNSSETQDPPMWCRPCGFFLEPDETLEEHIVSVHLTAEGLCDICGGNSEDFLEHFQIHVGKLKDRYGEYPMVQIKIEMDNGLDCHMKIAEEVFEGNPLYG